MSTILPNLPKTRLSRIGETIDSFNIIRCDSDKSITEDTTGIMINNLAAESEIFRCKNVKTSLPSPACLSTASLPSPACLSPASLTSNIRKTSINSVDTDLTSYMAKFESDSDDNPELISLSDKLNSSVSINGLQFIIKWDGILKMIMPKQEKLTYKLLNIAIDEQHYNKLIDLSKFEIILQLIERLAEWSCKLINKKHGSTISYFKLIGTSTIKPLEIELLLDLGLIKRYYLTQFPIIVMEKDIVGAVFKKIDNGKTVYVNIVETNFLEKNNEWKLKGIRFYICQINQKKYVLKPTINYNSISSKTRHIPGLMRFMGINPHDPQIFERNITVYELNQLLKINVTLPEVKNFSFRNKIYTAIEYIDGHPLISLSKKDRINLYKKDSVISDFYSKQLFDALVGNCDANPTNILVLDDRIISIDYDLALSSTFTDIYDPFSMLSLDHKTQFKMSQLKQCCHYKGVSPFISKQIRDNILKVNPWNYYWKLLILGDSQLIATNINRFMQIRQYLKSDELTIIGNDEWNNVYTKIRHMDYQDRINTSYFL